MTTADAILRDILADPDDDTLRLIYADWLEEAGDADLPAFIRASIEWAAPRSGKLFSERRADLMDAWARTDDATHPPGHSYLLHTPCEEIPDDITFAYWRGLPEVWCVADVPTFEREALAVFSAHPIRRVVLRCVVNRILVDATDAILNPLRDWPGDACRLPRALFAILAGGRYYKGNMDTCPLRTYPDTDLARADLESALSRWGRSLAGLPAPESP